MPVELNPGQSGYAGQTELASGSTVVGSCHQVVGLCVRDPQEPDVRRGDSLQPGFRGKPCRGAGLLSVLWLPGCLHDYPRVHEGPGPMTDTVWLNLTIAGLPTPVTAAWPTIDWQAKHPALLASPGEGQPCQDPQVWSLVEWTFTASGMLVVAKYEPTPRGMRLFVTDERVAFACRETRKPGSGADRATEWLEKVDAGLHGIVNPVVGALQAAVDVGVDRAQDRVTRRLRRGRETEDALGDLLYADRHVAGQIHFDWVWAVGARAAADSKSAPALRVVGSHWDADDRMMVRGLDVSVILGPRGFVGLWQDVVLRLSNRKLATDHYTAQQREQVRAAGLRYEHPLTPGQWTSIEFPSIAMPGK